MHRVVALVSAPQASFELGCAAAVFREAPYRFSVCTERTGKVHTTEGFDMVVTSGLRALDRVDTIVVPGWLPINREPTGAVLRALTRAHRRGGRLVSLCSGGYVCRGPPSPPPPRCDPFAGRPWGATPTPPRTRGAPPGVQPP